MLEQEERFSSEWRALTDVRRELALAGAWSVFANSSFPELPNSLLVLRDREKGHRLQTLGPRTWIRIDEQQVDEYAVIPTHLGLDVVARRFGAICEEKRLQLDVTALGLQGEGQESGSAPDPHRHEPQLISALRTKVLEFIGSDPEKPHVRNPHPGVGFVGISGLDRQLRVASAHGVDVVDITAALELEHGTTRLAVFGASAVYGHGIVGPAGLHARRADLGGQLLASKRPTGAKGIAVVVPDRADDVSLRTLRSHLGRAWFVWHPVAVALAAADQLPRSRRLRAVVIALSDTVDDVTILDCEDAGSERACWLRDKPLPIQPWSLEESVLHSVESDRDVLAAWIRATRDAHTVWIRHAEGFRRERLPSMRDARLRALDTAFAAGEAAGFDVVIVAGGDLSVEELVRRRTKRPVISLSADASAEGARIFLERHHADLPTWKDRLPHLAIEVNENRMRAFVDIVPKNQWAKPGQVLTFDSATKLTLRAGANAVDLHLSKDEQSVPYSLRLEGRPFPLAKAVEVRTHVRFEYGIEDIQGEFRPAGPAAFQSLRFRWSAGTSPNHAPDAAPPCIPAYREPAPLASNNWQAIQDALQELAKAWSKVDQKTRTKAATQVLPDAQLQSELQRVVNALRAVRGSGPATITKQQREGLEQQVARRLEWLLDIASSPTKGDGRPPRLADRTLLLVLQARGHTHVRGTNDKKLLELLRNIKNVNEALLTLGRIIDGRSDHAFEQLMNTETRTDSLRRRFGEAVREALGSHPDLASAMSEDQALRLLDRLVVETEALDRSPNMRTNFAQLLLAIPQLCRARTTGALRFDVTASYVQRLRQLRSVLPPEILKHAEGSDARDEPLSMAVDALEGREVNLPIVEVA
jgi:hypothetical protein